MRALLSAAVLSGVAACNALSGANAIDFTSTSSAGGSGGENGDGGDGGEPLDGGVDGHGGSTDGSAAVGFPLLCHTDDVAVGVYGTCGSFLDQIGLVCAKVASGKPASNTYKVGVAGTNVGPVPYAYQCPTTDAGVQEVIVGLTYNTGAHVNQIDVQCQTISAWASGGKVDKTSGFLGGTPVGPDAGTPSMVCAKGSELCGLYGKSALYVDSFEKPCCASH